MREGVLFLGGKARKGLARYIVGRPRNARQAKFGHVNSTEPGSRVFANTRDCSEDKRSWGEQVREMGMGGRNRPSELWFESPRCMGVEFLRANAFGKGRGS